MVAAGAAAVVAVAVAVAGHCSTLAEGAADAAVAGHRLAQVAVAVGAAVAAGVAPAAREWEVLQSVHASLFLFQVI